MYGRMSRSTIHSFLMGAAAVGAATVIVVMAGAAVGVWPRPHLLVAPAGVLAAAVAVFLARRDLTHVPVRVGAVAGGLAVIGSELVVGTAGFGVVQIVAGVSTVVVAAGGPGVLRPLSRPVPGSLVWLGLLGLVFVLMRIVVEGGALGHDEAAYAVKARAWVDGTPDTGWSLHRGIGQSVLAAAILPFSQSAEALRLVSVVLSVGTVVAVWGLGRTMRSNRAGLVAAGVFAVAPSFLRRGAEFLSDVPSTGLLIVVAILVWRWVSSEPARHAYLYWAVAAGAAAFYIRYQSILTLALLAIAVVVVAWDRVGESRSAIGRAAGLGILLLLPHFIFAVGTAGAPWGIILTTAGAGGREYLGEGLVDYLRDFPDLLAGQLGAVAILTALVWSVRRLANGRDRRPVLFLMVPAVGQVLILGLVSHGEPRFVFFPVALTAVAAGIAFDDLRRLVPADVYRAVAVGLVVAMIGSLGLHGDRADRNAEARAETIEALVEAARTVRAQADGPCGIVTGSLPQMTWLSGCATAGFDLRNPEVRLDPDLDRFLVLSDRGPRQPEGDLRQSYLALTEGAPTVVESDGAFGDVAVFRVAG